MQRGELAEPVHVLQCLGVLLRDDERLLVLPAVHDAVRHEPDLLLLHAAGSREVIQDAREQILVWASVVPMALVGVALVVGAAAETSEEDLGSSGASRPQDTHAQHSHHRPCGCPCPSPCRYSTSA